MAGASGSFDVGASRMSKTPAARTVMGRGGSGVGVGPGSALAQIGRPGAEAVGVAPALGLDAHVVAGGLAAQGSDGGLRLGDRRERVVGEVADGVAVRDPVDVLAVDA